MSFAASPRARRPLVRPLALLLLLLAPAAPARGAAGPSPWWVFFADKGLADAAREEEAIAAARAALAPRALARRIAARGATPVDYLDIPVSRDHLASVRATGAAHRATSRWLNAVSVEADEAQLAAIRALPFVASVRPVARGRRAPLPRVEPVPAAARRDAASPVPAAADYGPSFTQLAQLQAERLHADGYTGKGVLICLMDTGFERAHAALDSIRVVAERDFINDDDDTGYEPGDYEYQHYHGTWVLSLIGGWAPGNLIGAAYGASFLLAKTEDVLSETPVEEDYWTEAAEWADSLGADLFSTSLVYVDWYTYDDLDGDTAIITIAADLAAANGIAVFNAAGNFGWDPWRYVGTPADGDSVLAIGAVDSLGIVAEFSSRGPTADGRTKPDLCALGVADYVALTGTLDQYGRGNGTSFACPLAAGVGALLLEARPGWQPAQLAQALRHGATRSFSPDNDYGWGVVRGWTSLRGQTAVPPPLPAAARETRFLVSPNPSAAGEVRFRFSLPENSPPATLALYDAGGRLVREIWQGGGAREPREPAWDGLDRGGNEVPAGVYFARLTVAGETLTRRVIRLP